MSHQQAYGSIPAIKNTDNGSFHDGTNSRVNKPSFWSKTAIGLVVAVAVVCYGGFKLMAGDRGELISKKDLAVDDDDEVAHIVESPKRDVLLDNDLDVTNLWHKQYLDHIGEDTERYGPKLDTWNQRFLKKSVHFKGPGHPILVIMGGEGSLDPPMLYPFVNEELAAYFGAFVLSPEHRFYGLSQPIKTPTVKELVQYLTPDQALADAVNMIQYIRYELGCSDDPTSKHYCPVITFGGSYPGFLSAMMRYRYGDYVDISYASSAPLDLYSQVVNSNAYFEKVTEVAEKESSGCANAVRSTLFAVQDELLANYTKVLDATSALGFCPDTFPAYVKDVPEFVSEVVVFLVPAIFADFNMAYYPPGPDTALGRACRIFKDDSYSAMERLSNFYFLRGQIEYDMDDKTQCFDIMLEIPSGPNAHIRGSDNSGTGGGYTGEMWEFQCCKDLIIRAGYSEASMFIPRHFSYDWHKQHCHERFPGVRVEPFRMAEQWEFNYLGDTTRIVFANGLNDGWSTSSILKTDNPHIEVINFPNGAHHSELRSHYPDARDTADIKAGYETVKDILGKWLGEIYGQQDHE